MKIINFWPFVILAILLVIVFVISSQSPGIVETMGYPYPGFVKVQPITPSIAYQDGHFLTAFTNALRTTIKIINLTAEESINGSECESITISNTTIKSLDTFVLKAENCPKKLKGEPYAMVINITYNYTENGLETSRTEIGHINGLVVE
jgi:hypothetical protein